MIRSEALKISGKRDYVSLHRVCSEVDPGTAEVRRTEDEPSVVDHQP